MFLVLYFSISLESCHCREKDFEVWKNSGKMERTLIEHILFARYMRALHKGVNYVHDIYKYTGSDCVV